MTQLKEQRLKPAEGQQPVALLRKYRRGHGWGHFPLYDPADAAEMRPLSAKQQAAMTAQRTCPECGQVRGYVVHRMCQECADREQQQRLELQRRTCMWCRRVSPTPHPVSASLKGRRGECVPCWLHRVIRRQLEEEPLVVWRRTCPGRDCHKVTATDEEVAAGTWGGPRWCSPCAERDEQERAERERERREAEERAVEARRREVEALEEWARDILADPDTAILDMETTGLHDEARIVDLGVTGAAGDVLVDTLINPGEPIPPDATDMHKITDAEVATAPSFGAVLDKLAAVLHGRRCVIYNRAFDVARPRYELTVHYRQTGHEGPEGAADSWLGKARFEDAMVPYSDFCLQVVGIRPLPPAAGPDPDAAVGGRGRQPRGIPGRARIDRGRGQHPGHPSGGHVAAAGLGDPHGHRTGPRHPRRRARAKAPAGTDGP
ncbi:exonuclease domain-containing protein [Streptomyces antimycoticus]|uniref:exonuclease domain-containing protein n=1 Tax=Streptomyces antimycoticus TaxID=68175 RepID=UPI0036E1CF9B